MKLTKVRLSLLLIFILALILRIISAYHSHVSTDEMFYSLIPLNIISANSLGTLFQSQLYFYLADLGYRLFGGITAISVRLPSIIFGSLTIFVVYFMSWELFRNRKLSLLSSFLFAISGFALKYNLESDMPAFFFALLSILFFIRALRGNRNNLYLASIFLALAVLIKTIIVFLIPAYIIIFLIYIVKERKKFNKKFILTVLGSIFIALLILSPVFIHNYLSYQETGYTDFYISALGYGKNFYPELENKSWDLNRLASVSKEQALEFLQIDAIIFIFGILGVIFSWKKSKYFSSLLILSLFFLFIYIAGKTGSATHFLWVPVVLSIFASYGMFYIAKLIRKYFRYIIPLLIIIALIITGFTLKEIIEQREKSITLLMLDYINEQIPDDAIIVLDSRIYSGTNAWLFNDRHYISDSSFLDLNRLPLGTLEGEQIQLPYYYVECGPGTTCGWKPEDFERISSFAESMSVILKENAQQTAQITGVESFIIYNSTLMAPSGIFEFIDRSHYLWGYPVGWKYPETAPDSYQVEGSQKQLQRFGLLILYLDVLLALLTIPWIFYLIFRRKKATTRLHINLKTP